jgi:predicted RNA-binding Zn-ribbon protein involved in translation (DUF1610 family)
MSNTDDDEKDDGVISISGAVQADERFVEEPDGTYVLKKFSKYHKLGVTYFCESCEKETKITESSSKYRFECIKCGSSDGIVVKIRSDYASN